MQKPRGRVNPAPRRAIQTRPRIVELEPLGEIYLTAAEIQARVAELGAEIASDYEGREPVLVSSLTWTKSGPEGPAAKPVS